MDESLKKRWVEALRSGEYKQGYFYLRRKEDSYCCLGVLYEVIMGKDGWIDECDTFWRTNDRNSQILPYELTFEVGLDRKLMTNLTEMNDRGHSFDEIANEIERSG